MDLIRNEKNELMNIKVGFFSGDVEAKFKRDPQWGRAEWCSSHEQG